MGRKKLILKKKLLQADARKQYGEVHIYKTTFRGMKHTLTKREEKTLMKLIVHPETDKVREISCRVGARVFLRP